MNLQEWMKENNWSRRRLSKALDCDPGTIKNWIDGKAISIKLIARWQTYFDIDPVKEFGLAENDPLDNINKDK